MSDVPSAIDAECQVLGACMASTEVYLEARRVLSNDDWYAPAHELIWGAMATLFATGQPCEPGLLVSQLARDDTLSRMGGADYVAAVYTKLGVAASWRHYADQVAEAAIRRRLLEAGQRIMQMSTRNDLDTADALQEARINLDMVAGLRRTTERIEGLQSYQEYISQHAGKPGNWVLPGCIGARDVWMILAPPGAGKTMLSRHLTWSLAVGRHPWYLDRKIQPKRVLHIDLEVDPGMGADESEQFFRRFDRIDAGVEDRAFIWSKPEGINVRKASDALLLDDVVGEFRPDLICIGSLYKSFNRGSDWDTGANEAREVFDQIRNRHNTALWIEHHMPKSGADGKRQTPFGSSVWEWWASHGRVLEKAVAGQVASPFLFTAPFRGDRGVRESPVGFTRGGAYPWDSIFDEGQMTVLVEACGGTYV